MRMPPVRAIGAVLPIAVLVALFAAFLAPCPVLAESGTRDLVLEELESEPGPQTRDLVLDTEDETRSNATATEAWDKVPEEAVESGELTLPDGSRYQGEYVRNEAGQELPHGQGLLFKDDGSYYEGEFVQGMKHGQGMEKTSDNVFYGGDFREGQRNGKGIMRFPDGTLYKGEFAAGVFHGHGLLTGPDKKSYEGEFAQGKKNGLGRLCNEQGDAYYIGGFQDDQPHGLALYRDEDGRAMEAMFQQGEVVEVLHMMPGSGLYQGEWNEQGEFHGRGVLEEEGGCVYRGDFRNGKLHGKGVEVCRYYYYRGYFKLGRKHGVGTEISGDVEYRGDFFEGYRQGKGVEQRPGLFRYEGEFRNGSRNGQGVLESAVGSVYRGEFADGYFQGQGELVMPDMAVFTGEFVEDMIQGQGTLTLPDGRVVTGEFSTDWSDQGKVLVLPDGTRQNRRW